MRGFVILYQLDQVGWIFGRSSWHSHVVRAHILRFRSPKT